MKKIIAILIMAAGFISSCKKAEELKYSSSDSIYLNFPDGATGGRDSVIYTFAYTPERVKDTVYIPVSISGTRKPFDRKFKVVVITAGTTAEVGKHYEAFKGEYIVPANQGKVTLPIIVYNTDASLSTKAVALNFRLTESDDFGVSIIKMINGRLVISNKLEKPTWWGPGSNTWGIPNYSQVKHELWLISTNVVNVPYDPLNYPQFAYYSGLLSALLNSPSTWIVNNPARGYKLDLRSDGNYDFYNTANPSKKTLYKKNVQSGKFFFIDENGKDII